MADHTPTNYFESLISFGDRHFKFDVDCAGSEVRFEYRKQRFVICFPNFTFEQRNNSGFPTVTLNGTRTAIGWLVNSPESIGSAASRNERDKKILSFICSQLIVRSYGKMNATEMRKAKKNLAEWRNIFSKWIETVEYTDLESFDTDVEQEDSLESFSVSHVKSKKARRLKSRAPSQITITTNITPAIQKHTLKKALKLSSTGIYPPGYYVQLISALKHLKQKQFRQCVLDSATAFEMALIQLLDLRLSTITTAQKKLIEKKYQQIRNLSIALRKLGENLPSDIDIMTKIAEPRNKAIHRGIEVTKKQAIDALEFTKSLIYAKFPY